MRRADRLFRIIQTLRRRRIVTARDLAGELEVSERTIYRDMRDLSLSGVPILGEAGVGYALPAGYDLPPLMFTEEELEALVLGARMVESWGDPALARAAAQALAKVEVVLPERLRAQSAQPPLYAPARRLAAETAEKLELLRATIKGRRKLALTYDSISGERSERTVHPLCLFFWGTVWTFAAWCTLRQDFRHFRVDRVAEARMSEEQFEEVPGQTLEDFFSQIAEEDNARLARRMGEAAEGGE